MWEKKRRGVEEWGDGSGQDVTTRISLELPVCVFEKTLLTTVLEAP